MVRRLAAVVLALLGACDSLPPRPDAGTTAWRLAQAMPRRALEPGVAALGQQIVMVGGFATGLREGLDITAEVNAYDVNEQTWHTLPDAPVRWTHANLATVGATLYLLGGLEGAQYAARGEGFALDPVSRAWIPLAAMDPPRGAAAVVTAPGRIYLLGGATATEAVASCLEYDIAADRWTQLPDLPEPRSHLAAMRMVDGSLVVAGGLAGVDSSAPRGEVWVLPPPSVGFPDNRVWHARTPLHPPGDPGLHGGCAYGVVIGELVCAGGESGGGAQRLVDSYDPYLDVWTSREPMPVDRAGTQGAVIGLRMYIPGGAETLTFTPTDTLYIYVPLDTAR